MSSVSDTGTTSTTSPFRVGGDLKPAAGELKMTRQQAADALYAELMQARNTRRELDLDAQDEGGWQGFAQGVDRALDLGARGFEAAAQELMPPSSPGADPVRELADKLAALLPEDALYPSVITKIDRRQLVATVMHPQADAAPVTVGGVTFSGADRQLAGYLFEQEQDRVRAAATNLAAVYNITGDDEVRAFVDDAVSDWHDNGSTLAVSPAFTATDPASLEAAAVAAAPAPGKTAATSFADFAATTNGILNGTATNDAPLLTDADVQQIFRLANSDIGAVNEYVSTVAAIRAEGIPFDETFRVQGGTFPGETVAKPTNVQNRDDYVRQQAEIARKRKGGRGYTITEAKDLLYGMPKADVAKIQKLLMQSGLFAAANGEDAEPQFRGDPTDEGTQRAWLKLISDSIRAGRPMFDTLAQKAAEAGEKYMTVDGRRAKDVIVSDSAAVGLAGDDLGQQQLGRKLTDEEKAKVVEFIHGLEKGQATALQPDGAQTAENVDVNAQIQTYLETQFPIEAAGKDVAETYDVFSKLLAGPGGR